MNKVIISAIMAGVFVAGAILISGGDGNGAPEGKNISLVDGKQIIEIQAKGGYNPRTTVAQAGLPTVLKLKTNNTFDCSLAVMIPSLSFRQNLPPTGEVLIDVPAQEKGSKINGLCSMGMYYFTVNFN